MAIMYPKSIAEYMPTDSERIVYQELKNQLPDSFDVFYSVSWTSHENGALVVIKDQEEWEKQFRERMISLKKKGNLTRSYLSYILEQLDEERLGNFLA